MPALAVGRELRKFKPDWEFIYIGAYDSIEERLAKGDGYRFLGVNISPLRRGVILPNLRVPYQAIASVVKTMWCLNREGVIGVFGSGGFSSWPACAAARQLHLPYFLEDGNAFPGLVTRLLARKASQIYLAYDETARKLKLDSSRYTLSGIPVSSLVGATSQAVAREALGLETGRFTLLATGGSGGARSINRALSEAWEKLIDSGMNIIWQTGKQIEALPEVPAALRSRMIVERFLDPARMAQALSSSDLALTRCGMMTLAELAVAGRPAILVPFPFSAEGHQEANAKAVSEAGGGVMILDREFNPDRLLEAVTEIRASKLHEAMSAAMLRLSKPGAAGTIAEDIIRRVES